MRAVLLGVLVLLVLAPAASSAGWTPTVDLLPAASEVDYNEQALGPNGDAAVVWHAISTPNFVNGTTRAPGQPFAPAAPLAPPDVASVEPQAAVDAAGNVLVIFLSGSPAAARTVKATFRPAGGTFSEPVDISAPGDAPIQARLAMNAAGEAVAVWNADAGVDILKAAIRPAGGDFGSTMTLAPVTTRGEVAIDDAGGAVIAFRNDDAPQRISVFRRAPGAATFGGPTPVSGVNHGAVNAEVVMNAAGHAVVTWTASDPSPGTALRAWAAYAPPDGAFSVQDELGTASNTSAPGSALDAAGNALLIWAGDELAQLARTPVGGSAGEPVAMSEPGDEPVYPDAAMSPSGAAVLFWQRSDGTNERLQASIGSFGGPFGEPEDVSPAGTHADIGHIEMDAHGNALASWLRRAGSQYIPQVRVYDAVAPELRGLAIPAAGVAGRPLAFGVSPFDTWSAVSTVWSFGDGGASAEVAPNHTYAAPGTYDVSVTATDLGGNATTRGGQVAVAAAPTTIPVLARLRLKPRRFRALRKGGSIAGTIAARRGTRVRYRLDVAARVTFRVQKRRRSGKFKRVRGGFGVDSLAGRNSLRFSGRLRDRRLRPGRYRLVARPRNGAGKGERVRARFRVLKR